jgi:hypothetical protein
LSWNRYSVDRSPVVPAEVRIESVGVNPLDQRRVDVALDLTPSQQPLDVEMVIVGPDDDELCSILLLQNREWMLDKVMHLRSDAAVGTHILHVGVFFENSLVTRTARAFRFPAPDSSKEE